MSNSINFHDEDIAKYECKPSRCQLFVQSFYNSRSKTFLGRTKGSWCKIGIFYFIYYCSLTAFFMSMMMVFLEGLVSNDVPSRTGQHSLLKLEPGLGMRPLPDHTTTLIRFASHEPQSYMSYFLDMRNFLTPYQDIITIYNTNNFANCTSSGKEPDDVKKICRYDLSKLGDCNEANNFGYSSGKPCVFIKMNKIFGWIPSTKDNQSPAITCSGQNLIDRENIGEMKFFPSNGTESTSGYFDHNFYPYIGQPGYLSPIVAVQFMTPKKNMVIMVKCYFTNVHFNSDLKFELLVD